VRTASSTWREGFVFWSWASSEREDEEGEARSGSEAEESRFNVGVMVSMCGNSFYISIFGQSGSQVSRSSCTCIWILQECPGETYSRKCETEERHLAANRRERSIQTPTKHQYSASLLRTGPNAISATTLLQENSKL
jgi:hypothetical protein